MTLSAAWLLHSRPSVGGAEINCSGKRKWNYNNADQMKQKHGELFSSSQGIQMT